MILRIASRSTPSSLGYPDGQRISRTEMVAIVNRIAEAFSIPVTADMEAGYGNEPKEIAITAREIVAAGAVGLNLEDSLHERPGTLVEVNLQKEKIHAAVAAGQSAGIPLVLNARTDVFWAEIGDPDTRLAHALERLNAYREAGAACLFAPAVKDPAVIAEIEQAQNRG